MNRLHEAGVLTIRSSNQIVRRVPALKLPRQHAEAALVVIEGVVKTLG